MTSFPLSPRLAKCGFVLLDAESASVLSVIALQYNPDTLSRTLVAQTVSDAADRSTPMRFTSPPVETLKLDAEIDATDLLEAPDQNPVAVESGIHAQLAILELMIYPSAAKLQANNALAQAGTLEIIPIEAPLVLFVLGPNRMMPVRITEFSVTEEAFSPTLNPLRAKVSLGLRVLNVNDLGFNHKGGSLYLMYQIKKESFAAKARTAVFGTLGIGGIP
ncbi:MAG TPA: hypothetical protein VHX14_14710 [Thermoanaerobaculia bacterium]|jgi:hypothetical protein|nr:hypothetical protein [Thermoanaerobaculia bacterium]